MIKYILFILTIAFVAPISAYAQTSGDTTTGSTNTANASANSEKTTDIMMGTVSAATGGVIMKADCPDAVPPNAAAMVMCYAVGPGLIASGIYDIVKGLSNQSTIDGTTGTPATTTTGTDPTAGLPPYAANPVQSAINTAKQYGVDPTNPGSVAAAAQQAGGGDPSSAMANMPASLASAIDAEKAKIVSGFHISAVETEGASGGQRQVANNGEDGPNMNDLLNGLKKRDPASVAGLQKTLNGEPIGVAGDNIFKQVTRRYQSKIATKSFIEQLALVKHK